MKSVFNEALKCALLGNCMHLVIALLYSCVDYKNQGLVTLFLVLTLTIWFVIGFYYSFTGKKKNDTNLISLSIISILPHVLILITSQTLANVDTFNSFQNYNLFFFIGAPLLLYNKPLAPIMSLFKNSNIYIQISINVMIVFFLIFLGGFIGKFIVDRQK